MNPSDVFESFDDDNFDDFMAVMMPMPEDMLQLDSVSSIDHVFEAPVLSRHSKTAQTQAQPVDDLFAVLNTPVNGGSTPVYIAAQNGHVGVIRALAEQGADLNTPTKNGEIPL
jgi:ankyrin repeat protein